MPGKSRKDALIKDAYFTAEMIPTPESEIAREKSQESKTAREKRFVSLQSSVHAESDDVLVENGFEQDYPAFDSSHYAQRDEDELAELEYAAQLNKEAAHFDNLEIAKMLAIESEEAELNRLWESESAEEELPTKKESAEERIAHSKALKNIKDYASYLEAENAKIVDDYYKKNGLKEKEQTYDYPIQTSKDFRTLRFFHSPDNPGEPKTTVEPTYSVRKKF